MCTQSNTCFFGPTQVQIPNGISISSAVFAQLMAGSHYTLQQATLPPSKLPLPMGDIGGYEPPHLIYDSLDPPVWRFLGLSTVFNPNGISSTSAVQPFLRNSRQSIPILYNGEAFPLKIANSHEGIWTVFKIHNSLGPSSPKPEWHLDCFSRFFHRSSQSVPIYFTMSHPMPVPMGIWTPIYGFLGHPSPRPKRHLDRFSSLLQGSLL